MLPIDFQSKFNEAWDFRNRGNYEQVITIAQEYLPKTRNLKDKASEALFLKLLAQVHADKGEQRDALKYYKQIERLYIDLKDDARQMHTLRHIGGLYYELGELECAQKCLVQVVDAYAVTSPNELESANTFRIYAMVMEGMMENAKAVNYWKKAQDLYQSVGIIEGVEECDAHLNKLHRA